MTAVKSAAPHHWLEFPHPHPNTQSLQKSLDSACSRCGVNAVHKSGAPNCCSEGGAWAGMCDEGGKHTWHEGFQACSRTSEASSRLRPSSQPAQEAKTVFDRLAAGLKLRP